MISADSALVSNLIIIGLLSEVACKIPDCLIDYSIFRLEGAGMTFAESLKVYRWYLISLLLFISALYARIVPDMVMDWYNDENYSHGFLVPLIAGYFIYTRWGELGNTRLAPRKAGLLIILFALFQLLVGWLGTEYFTMRSSLIVILTGLVLTFWGTAVLRILSLPLAYLFFMVPIPYIIYDSVAFPLKIFVTKVSVWTLKIAGVVVMSEGNIIMFPATTLEVADACSGIRSLLSLLALAVAYAFFIRIASWKRCLLICSAVPIAVFTNATRVIATGFLAQYWGEKAAQGFFHEFAGMAVFGLAMIMLVSLGAVLARGESKAEDREQRAEDREQRTEDREQRRGLAYSFAAVLVMFAVVGLYINLHRDIEVPISKPFDQFPVNVSGWRMVGDFQLSASVQKVLKATDTLSRQYVTADGKPVGLYIGYHGGGKESGAIHSPKHCLPGSGWFEVSTRKKELELAGERLNLVHAVYQKGSERQVFIYWFQARDKTLSDEYSLKLAEITNSLLYRRRDTAFIRISVPFETDQQAATALGELFLKDMLPTIRTFLPT